MGKITIPSGSSKLLIEETDGNPSERVKELEVTPDHLTITDGVASLDLDFIPTPSGLTDHTIIRANGTDAIQGSNILVDDSGNLGDTTNRIPKGWFTDLDVADDLVIDDDLTVNGDILNANATHNEGILSDPVITDTSTGGVAKIGLTSVEVLIRATTDWTGDLYKFTVPANAALTLTDSSVNYVYVDYNSGSPIYAVTTNRDTINLSDHQPVVRVMTGVGTVEYYLLYGAPGLSQAMMNYSRVMRNRGEGGIEKETGGVLLSESSQKIVISSGYIWFGNRRIQSNSCTQADGGITTDFWYHSGGNWTKSSATTTYNNTQYDNGTALADLTANHYAVNWIFKHATEDEIDYMLGGGDYTLAQAQAAAMPTPPVQLQYFYTLVGRIIVKKSAGSATQIDQVDNSDFVFSQANEHSDLLGLTTGNDHTQYLLKGAKSIVVDVNATADIAGYLYNDIQTACDYLDDQTGTWNILIYPGTYTENVSIAKQTGKAPVLNFVGLGDKYNGVILTPSSTASSVLTTADGVQANFSNIKFTGAMDDTKDLITIANTGAISDQIYFSHCYAYNSKTGAISGKVFNLTGTGAGNQILTLSDCLVQGNASGATTTLIGLNIPASQLVKVINTRFLDFAGTSGVGIANAGTLSCSSVSYRNCTTDRNGAGTFQDSNQYFNAITGTSSYWGIDSNGKATIKRVVTDKSGSASLTKAESINADVYVSATGTATLPDASAADMVGTTITVWSTSAAAVSVKPYSGQYLILSGTTLDANDKVTNDSTNGSYITFTCKAVNYWISKDMNGVWFDSGA